MSFLGSSLAMRISVVAIILAIGFVARASWEILDLGVYSDVGVSGVANAQEFDDTTSDSASEDQYSTSSGQQEDTNGDSDDETTTSPARDQYTEDKGDLLEAGGTITGPVPKMLGSDCPKEFPVEKQKGCYAE